MQAMIVHLNARRNTRRGDSQRPAIPRELAQGAIVLVFPWRPDFDRTPPGYEALLSRLQSENDTLRRGIAELTAQIRELSENQAKAHKRTLSLLP
jgi:hypothetical protein